MADVSKCHIYFKLQYHTTVNFYFYLVNFALEQRNISFAGKGCLLSTTLNKHIIIYILTMRTAASVNKVSIFLVIAHSNNSDM